MNDGSASRKVRPIVAAGVMVAVTSATLLGAALIRDQPWGLDLWLVLMAIVIAEIIVGAVVVKSRIQAASGASMVIGGWSPVRIVLGIILISIVLGVVHLIIPEENESVRPDRYAMIAIAIWIAWNLIGVSFVMDADAAIIEKEKPVVEVKRQDRVESVKLDRVRRRIESLEGADAEERKMIDRLRRDLQEAEMVLAHSTGGGIGSIESPKSPHGDVDGLVRTKELVVSLQSALDDVDEDASPSRGEQLKVVQKKLRSLVEELEDRDMT